MDDKQIVELFFSRDENAIRESAAKYGARLYALAHGIVADRQTAEECEHDTYLEAWNRIPPHEPKNYLYAFLARITRHIALNCCRDRARLKRSAFLCELSREMEACIPSPDDMDSRIDDMMLREILNGFLGGLPEEKRNLFIRRYWYLCSIQDIAESYGMTESNVKVLLFRMRNELKKQLEREGIYL